MPEVKFIDTTLRDGSQSLWASRLSTSTMLAVIDDLDAAGFESMEFGNGPGVRAIQELDEDPSAWLRLGPPRARATSLRWTGGMGGGIMGRSVNTSPKCINEIKFRMIVDQGITITRTSDCWNNYTRFGEAVRAMEKIGMRTIANLIYSISPRHTDEYYVQKATEAAAIRPYRICFKDVGGILTPERAKELIPKILAATGDVPVEFHAHCCTGMAATCILVAVQCGIQYIHTGIPPLAESTAQPSIFTAVQNLNELGFDTGIDLEPLRRASEKLYAIARRHDYPIGAPTELDYRQYKHQIPGGMISHLAFQLKQVGKEAKLPEALAETARVREDLGYPIMVTPLSQFVGSQAAINIITGQRYASVTDEVIRYAQGYYGDEAIEAMNPEVRELIVNRKRADELSAEDEEPEESLEEIRSRFGDVTDEELVYLVPFGMRALPYLRREKEVTAYRFDTSPEARWLRELPAQSGQPQVVEVQRDGVTLRVGLSRPAEKSA